MKTITVAKGDVIHKTGDICSTLELVKEGKVILKGNGFSIILKKGSVIGAMENSGSPYVFEYEADENLELCIYEYINDESIKELAESCLSQSESLVTASSALVVNAVSKYRFIKKQSERFISLLNNKYGEYKELCEDNRLEIQSFPFLDELEPFSSETEVPEIICDFYDQIELMPEDIKNNFFGVHEILPVAWIYMALEYSRKSLKLCCEVKDYINGLLDGYFTAYGVNLFSLYRNLYEKAQTLKCDQVVFSKISGNVQNLYTELVSNPLVPEELVINSYAEYREYVSSLGENEISNEEESIFEPIMHSLDVILKNACLDESEEERFRADIRTYRLLKDKNAADDEAVKLRQNITKTFFEIYEFAIISSLEASTVPVILKMFFNYGYLDENLTGKENALKLYKMAEKLADEPVSDVYTAYGWLKSIYEGKNEPSRNEFDQDYVTYVRLLRQGGYLSEEMEKRYLESNKEKVRYEIHNFLKNAMKISTGKAGSFCPVLSQHNILRQLETMEVSAQSIEKNWTLLKSIDYSCFYRECTYQNERFRISREPIMLEVMPAVILLPGIGRRSGIWQETSGVRRDTKARMYMPSFTSEDVFFMQLHMAGEFRWEICKKIQGARWNDVTTHSLTGDYFDYLQFYRKNSDLSPDAKEKVKSSLTNNKNSFKNVFVADYINWIRYESQGSPRLNKVAKELMYTYCPFSKSIRQKLVNNPMFTDIIKSRELKDAKMQKLLDARYSKIKDSNGELPSEIEKYIRFYSL